MAISRSKAARPAAFFPNLPRTFAEIPDVVDWKTVGPRLSAAYDLMGNGRTGLKIAAGRYYYMIASGGGILGGFNPNGNYSEQYAWNDANGDRKFQPGEQHRHSGDLRVSTPPRCRAIRITAVPTPMNSPAASITSCSPTCGSA